MYVKRGEKVGSFKYKNPYFSAKQINLETNWNNLRIQGKQKLSPQAQAKLEWMIFYHTVGDQNAKKTAETISKKTEIKGKNSYT